MSVYKYTFDDTASNPVNRLTNEPYEFNTSDVHVIISNEGLFYTKGLTITNQATGNDLDLGDDYEFISLDPDIVAITGHEAAAGIQLINTTFVGTLLLSCQLVGGPEGKNNTFVKELNGTIAAADDNIEIDWAKVQNKPSHFPGSMHTHAISSLEGLDAVADSFASLQAALKDRRPMYASVHNILEQQERTLQLLGSFRKSLNSLVAVTGSAQLITDMQEQLENLASRVDKTGNGLQGFTTTLGSWNTGSFTRLTGIVTFVTGSATHSVQVDIASDGTLTNYTRSNELKTVDDLFTLAVSESSGTVRLELKPVVTGVYKFKLLSAL